MHILGTKNALSNHRRKADIFPINCRLYLFKKIHQGNTIYFYGTLYGLVRKAHQTTAHKTTRLLRSDFRRNYTCIIMEI